MSAANDLNETAPIIVHERSVACDGGDGPLGHPRVWLRIAADNEVVCPYCSRHYILEGEGHDTH
jgi:uncharacterized Zn-finger protein